MAEQTGADPPELAMRELPEVLSYVWEWFLDLHGARGSNGFGPSAITWLDMQAYFNLQRVGPGPRELDLIRRLDRMALNSVHAKPAAPEAPPGPKLEPGKPHLRGPRK